MSPAPSPLTGSNSIIIPIPPVRAAKPGTAGQSPCHLLLPVLRPRARAAYTAGRLVNKGGGVSVHGEVQQQQKRRWEHGGEQGREAVECLSSRAEIHGADALQCVPESGQILRRAGAS